MVHDAVKYPEYELRLALMHNDAGNNEVHALAIADGLVVKTVSEQNVTSFH